MKIKNLISALEKLDPEAEAAVDGYDYDVYSPDIAVREISVSEHGNNFYYEKASSKTVVVISRAWIK
jgi:hypothetical protein